MITAGIDIGMYSVKIVLFNENTLISQCAMPCGKNPAELVVEAAFNQTLDEVRLSPRDVKFIVGTGTECSDIPYADEFAAHAVCLAKGCYKISNSIQTIIDMGMLKTLVVKMKNGIPIKVASNDKCAACNGMYLEMVSRSLQVEMEDMEKFAQKSTKPIEVTSTCAVFAESEIISLIHMKKKIEDILEGAFIALARRTYPLLLNVGFEKEISMVGGLANNLCIVKAMEQQLDLPIIVPKSPEMIAALGAAILGQERA